MSTGKSPSVAGAAATGADTEAGPIGSVASGSVDSGGGCGEAEGTGLIRVRDGMDEDERWRENEVTPLRSPYRPSASDPITASLNFPHPSASIPSASVSSFLASSLFKLAPWSSLSPYKEGGKGT